MDSPSLADMLAIFLALVNGLGALTEHSLSLCKRDGVGEEKRQYRCF